MLGLLGALDPYKHKVNIGMIDQSRDASAVSLSESKSSQDSGRPVIAITHHSFWSQFFTKTQNMDYCSFLFVYLKVTAVLNSQRNSWKVSKSHCVGVSVGDLGAFAVIGVWA